MRVTVDRKEFLGLIKSATSVARAGDERPVLRNLLLEAHDGELSISVTDMIVSMRLSLCGDVDSIEIHSTGRILVPAQNLQRVVSAIPAEKLTLSLDGNQCLINSGESQFSLLTEDPRDFPDLHRFSEDAPWVEIPADRFTGLVNRVALCAHDERSYFNMHGLLLKVGDNRLTLVATNGQRLAVASHDVGTVHNIEDDSDLFVAEQVVPADAAALLTNLTGAGSDESVHVQWFDKSLRVRGKYGEAVIVALQGGFVPYEMGIPKNDKELRLCRAELRTLLKQITALKSAGDPFMLVTLRDNSMTLKASVRDVGSSVISRTVDWPHPEISVYLNPAFIEASAKTYSSKDVVLKFGGQMDQPMLLEDTDGALESMCVYSVVREP